MVIDLLKSFDFSRSKYFGYLKVDLIPLKLNEKLEEGTLIIASAFSRFIFNFSKELEILSIFNIPYEPYKIAVLVIFPIRTSHELA